MCYPQPGPRCYTHARTKLNNAHSRVARAQEVENQTTGNERMKKALENLAHAQSEYDTTNEGMTELALLYKNGDNSAVKDRYRRRLTLAKKLRERQEAWAKEYNAQKRTNRKAPTQKMKDLEKSIKVVDEESTPLYKENTYGRQQPVAPVESPVEIAVTPHITAVEEPVIESKPHVESAPEPAEPVVYETSSHEYEPAVETEPPVVSKPTPVSPQFSTQEDTKKKAEVTMVKSLDSLDLSRPHAKKRKLAKQAQDSTVTPVEPVKTPTPMTPKSVAKKLEEQNGNHAIPVLYDHRNKEISARMIFLPQGRKVWEISERNGSVRRIPVSSSSDPQARSRYYAQFGVMEETHEVPGRVAYSPQENGYVIKAA